MSKKARILVVEDNRSLARVYARLLQKEGYRVLTAFDGLDGLQKAQERKPDLIILDVMMPKMDGFSVCRRLKSNPDTADIPVLMLTRMGSLVGPGHIEAKERYLDPVRERVTGFDVGAMDFLTKPVAAKPLLGRVKGLLWLAGFTE